MLPAAIALLACSLILFALALRGRVTARGTFCRKCKFDLQGLDLHAPNPTCPECGRDLARHNATLRTVRRTSRTPLAAALIAMMLAGGILLLQAPGAGSRMMVALPDAQVVWLTAQGMDTALDELAARATRPSPMAAPHLARAVELALAHQADASQPWDPRWGEVLAEAFLNDRMTDDQTARYLTHGFERIIRIRDRVNRPDARIGYRITSRPVRLHRLPGSLQQFTTKVLAIETVSIGATSPGAPNRGPGGSMGTQLTIPNQPQTGVSMMGSAVEVRAEDWTHAEPHDELTVRAAFRVRLRAPASGRTIEVMSIESDQRVRLLAENEPVVATIVDASAADQTAQGLGIQPFAILPVLPNTLPLHGATIARIGFTAEGLGHHAAGWLHLVDPRSGEEIRISRVVLHPSASNLSAFMIDWLVRAEPHNPSTADPERVIGAAKAVLDAGTATLIFRTDPSAAESEPDIDAVLGMTVVFERVPVHEAQTEADLTNSIQHGGVMIRGRLVEPDR